MNVADYVREFHAAFARTPDPERPVVRDAAVRILRIDLCREELAELEGALYDGDLPQIAKEGADLLYVTAGALLAHGIDPLAAVAEVHRSNMSKRGPGGEVLRRADGKVLKGPFYRPPDMGRVVG